ncbi:sugar transporter ERD6-like 6 [Aphidius gifuensis]|uniref:sugar transporter ERD6-like 6 n=1 Tax=Aphidius gifuensis TaxID=684658 RepID=UPI001CDBBFA3|nr:sugar transporter ERD6-like 6 [Aphidius gifuensis]
MCISYTHLIHDVPTNVPMLYTGRFISGIGTGMANALYLYTAAPHQRAWLASSGPILVSLGVLGSYVLGTSWHKLVAQARHKHVSLVHKLVPGLAQSFTPTWGALTTWQCTAAISIIPSILSLALVKFLPESLAWLARHGHSNEAKKSLLWLRGPGISYENEYKELCGDASIERRKKNSKIKLKTALLLPNVWKPFLILIIFFGLQQLSGIYIILFYAVNVLKEFGADIDGYIGSIAIGLVRLVASIINAFLAGHFGRRPLACTSAIGMTISSILVLLMKYNNYFLFIPKTLPIICIGCHVAFSMIRFLTLPWVLSSELYLLRFRGSLGRLTTDRKLKFIVNCFGRLYI